MQSQKPVGNLHTKNHAKNPVATHTPTLHDFPCELPCEPHDTLSSVALSRTFVGDSWEWHGKVRVAHALKKVSIGI